MGADEIAEMLRWEGVLGLAEVMDARAVIDETPRMSAILEAGRRAGGVIEGHNPMLRGRELNAYVAAGIDSDHTLMTPDLLREKARLGVCLQLQERYLSEELIAALLALPELPDINLVTDDVSPDYLEEKGPPRSGASARDRTGVAGHDGAARGNDCASAATAPLRPGRHRSGLLRRHRARRHLERFAVSTTISDGRVVVREGASFWDVPSGPGLDALRNSLNLAPVTLEMFRLTAPITDGEIDLRVIVSHNPGTSTEAALMTVTVRDGEPHPARKRRSLVDRRAGAGRRSRSWGCCADSGSAPARSPPATPMTATISRSSAATAESMATAANAVIAAGGGIAVAVGGETRALLPLPIAGVVSDQTAGRGRRAASGQFVTRCATLASTIRTC